MRVAVTGGAGFIGANLCRELLADERISSVSVVDDWSTGLAENLTGLDVEVVDGTILDDTALARTFDGADAVVHLAALGSVPRSVADPLASHAVNANSPFCKRSSSMVSKTIPQLFLLIARILDCNRWA